MKDFRSYVNDNQEKKMDESMIPENVTDQEKQQVKETIDKYSGYSEEQLMQELSTRVSQQKQQGKFNENELEGFINKVSPMLNREQRRKLADVAKKIKK